MWRKSKQFGHGWLSKTSKNRCFVTLSSASFAFFFLLDISGSLDILVHQVQLAQNYNNKQTTSSKIIMKLNLTKTEQYTFHGGRICCRTVMLDCTVWAYKSCISSSTAEMMEVLLWDFQENVFAHLISLNLVAVSKAFHPLLILLYKNNLIKRSQTELDKTPHNSTEEFGDGWPVTWRWLQAQSVFFCFVMFCWEAINPGSPPRLHSWHYFL